MTRAQVPGAYRVLIAAKVSQDMAERIDAVRGDVTRADWLRSAADHALAAQHVGGDWERRARDAEGRLARIAGVLLPGDTPREEPCPGCSGTGSHAGWCYLS